MEGSQTMVQAMLRSTGVVLAGVFRIFTFIIKRVSGARVRRRGKFINGNGYTGTWMDTNKTLPAFIQANKTFKKPIAAV